MKDCSRGLLAGLLLGALAMLCLDSGTRSAAADPPKDRYAYKVVAKSTYHGKDASALETVLNKETGEDWEFYTSTIDGTLVFRKKK